MLAIHTGELQLFSNSSSSLVLVFVTVGLHHILIYAGKMVHLSSASTEDIKSFSFNLAFLLIPCVVIILWIIVEVYFGAKSITMTRDQAKENDKILEENGSFAALMCSLKQDFSFKRKKNFLSQSIECVA